MLAIWYHLRWRRRQRLVAAEPPRARVRTNKPLNRFTVDPFILDPPRSTLPRYHDYSPGPASLSSSQTPSNPSQTASSSGGGSRYAPVVLQPQRSASFPAALSPSGSTEVLRSHGPPPSSSTSDPISPTSHNSSGTNSGTSRGTSNNNHSSSSRRHQDRRHRHQRHRQRERIAQMRREVADLRAQQQDLLARMEQPQALPPVDDQSHDHEKLPEYTR